MLAEGHVGFRNLLRVTRRDHDLWIIHVLLDQALERGPCQPPLVLEVAVDDQLALRMRWQPIGAMAQELLDLVLGDPVVLFPVHYWDQDIEVTEQIAQATSRLQFHGKVRAFAPVLKPGVQGITLSRDGVAHRLENPPE